MPVRHHSPFRQLPPPGPGWQEPHEVPGPALLTTPLRQELRQALPGAALLVRGVWKVPSHGPTQPQPNSQVPPEHSPPEKDEKSSPVQCLSTRGGRYQQREYG